MVQLYYISFTAAPSLLRYITTKPIASAKKIDDVLTAAPRKMLKVLSVNTKNFKYAKLRFSQANWFNVSPHKTFWSTPARAFLASSIITETNADLAIVKKKKYAGLPNETLFAKL